MLPSDSDVIGTGCGLSIRTFRNDPGDSSVQQFVNHRVSTHRGLKTLSGTNHDLVVCCWFTFNSQSNSQYIYIMRTIESLLCATKCPCRSRASSKSIHRAHSKQFNMSSLASTGAPVRDQGQVWRLIQQFQLSRASVGKIIQPISQNA